MQHMISGFISCDYNGWETIGGEGFATTMYRIADDEDTACAYETEYGLGGKRAVIGRCKVVMYTSQKEITFDEAQERFLDEMFGEGVFEMEANYTGYSEWTITGFDLDKCMLGGHDLNRILLSHDGEYANILVEVL